MSRATTQQTIFQPKPSRTESKADITNQTARAIIGAEVERREAKTARLRLARLAQEERLAALEPPVAPARAAAGKTARTKTGVKRRTLPAR